MPTQQPVQTFTPHETAALVGVAVHNIRRWAEYHAVYLSPTANPPTGQVKRFTGRDIEVLKHVKALRALGQTVAVINEQLKTITFAEIDNSLDTAITDTTLTAPPTTQESSQQAPAAIVLLNDLRNEFSAKFEALERARLEDNKITQHSVTMFALGFCAACLMFLLLVGLVVMYGR